MHYSPGKPPRHTKSYLWASLAIIILIGIITTLRFTHLFPFSHKQAIPVATPTKGGGSVNEQKGETRPNNSSTSTTTPSGTTQPGDNKSESGGSTEPLITPSGDFVSNHHPGQNGSPLTETSVCNTTPGATCQISFTKNGITRSLPAQTTDRGGTAYWNSWTPQSIGLTAGSWQIQATATLNGQTKTATDSIALVVSS